MAERPAAKVKTQIRFHQDLANPVTSKSDPSMKPIISIYVNCGCFFIAFSSIPAVKNVLDRIQGLEGSERECRFQ